MTTIDDDDQNLPLLERNICKACKGDCNPVHSIANCVALLIGLGALSSPYAIARGGYASLFLVFFVAIAYHFTTRILIRCLEINPELSDYQDVSTQAFGKIGRSFTTALFFVELLSALVSYGISVSDNLVSIFPNTQLGFMALRGRNFVTFLATLVLLPTVWVRSFRSLSLLSAVSITSSTSLLVALLWISVFNEIGVTQSLPLVCWDGILSEACGIYLFAYGANILLPSVRTSMIDPTKFPKVLACSFAIAAIYYGGIGLLGASMFGEKTESQITLNMPSNLVASKVAIWANIIMSMMKFSLLLRPVATELESLLPCQQNSRIHLLLTGTMRSVLLIAIILVALSLPYFATVVSFVGSSLTVTICLILPCLFYGKIFHGSMMTGEVATLVFFTVAGVSAGVVSTVYSIVSAMSL